MVNTQRARITKLARDTLIRAWRLDSGVWSTPESAVHDLLPIPVERIAKQLFGLDVELVPSISSERRGFEIAAMLDVHNKKVTLADASTHSVGEQNLSLAHELCHYIKHRALLPTIYRERMSKGYEIDDRKRPQIEREADWFAVDFTMPERLIASAFHGRYGLPISLDQVDEQLVYWLEAGTVSGSQFLTFASEESTISGT